MSDATHGLPVYRPDPDFGRAYRRPGEVVPRLALPRGWLVAVAASGAVAGWAALLGVVIF